MTSRFLSSPFTSHLFFPFQFLHPWNWTGGYQLTLRSNGHQPLLILPPHLVFIGRVRPRFFFYFKQSHVINRRWVTKLKKSFIDHTEWLTVFTRAGNVRMHCRKKTFYCLNHQTKTKTILLRLYCCNNESIYPPWLVYYLSWKTSSPHNTRTFKATLSGVQTRGRGRGRVGGAGPPWNQANFTLQDSEVAVFPVELSVFVCLH